MGLTANDRVTGQHPARIDILRHHKIQIEVPLSKSKNAKAMPRIFLKYCSDLFHIYSFPVGLSFSPFRKKILLSQRCLAPRLYREGWGVEALLRRDFVDDVQRHISLALFAQLLQQSLPLLGTSVRLVRRPCPVTIL